MTKKKTNHDKVERDEYGTVHYSDAERSGNLKALGSFLDAEAHLQVDGSWKLYDIKLELELHIDPLRLTTAKQAGWEAYDLGYAILAWYDQEGNQIDVNEAHSRTGS